MIQVFEPKITVKLIKVIYRLEAADNLPASRRMAEIKEIDLTDYIGEGSAVRVSKGVKDPAGAFSITLIDAMYKNFSDPRASEFFESIYGLIEPMDLIEIRFAHDPYLYSKPEEGYSLPVVMRGFVSDIQRVEAMGNDGKPIRHVTIGGQDYGKIFQILQVIYLNNASVGDNIIHGFQFLQKYNIDVSNFMSASEFVGDVVSKIIDGFIKQMPWYGSATSRPFTKLTTEASALGTISGPNVNAWPGGASVYSLLSTFCDVSSGFNELFVIDRDDDVAVVFRPTPFITPDGKLIDETNKGWFPEEQTIYDRDIVSISSSRSDSTVANLFWVRVPHHIMSSDMFLRLQDQLAPVADHDNCDPQLYGIRQMDTTVQLGSPKWSGGDARRKEKQADDYPSEEEWRLSKIDTLRRASQDAVVFERGTLRLHGNEKIKAGAFLNVLRSNVMSRVYVSHVDHEFIQYQGFMTTVQFERGTGFINRVQSDRYPFLNEMDASGVYGDA
jgi:hypothetical protein